MKASAFEQRHAMVLRSCIYAAAFGVYFFDRDDVVWRFIRDSPSRRLLEHTAFLAGTLVIGAGAYHCTRAEARADVPEGRNSGLWGEWLYAVGMSTLAPLWGCVILIAGESLRTLRLGSGDRPHDENEIDVAPSSRWSESLRRQAAKWGVTLTMVVFTITLVDRVADYGIVASVLVWIALNGSLIYRKCV